jgi:hypothetical protein
MIFDDFLAHGQVQSGVVVVSFGERVEQIFQGDRGNPPCSFFQFALSGNIPSVLIIILDVRPFGIVKRLSLC